MFRHLGLRLRLYLGFTALVVLCASTAGFGMVGLSRIGAYVGAMDVISSNLSRVSEASDQLEIIRRGANHYRLDGDARSLTDMKNAEVRAAQLMAELAASAPSDERRRSYEAISAKLHETIADREAFTTSFDAGWAERARLFTTGDALTAAAERLVSASKTATLPEQLAAERLNSAVLLVRVANWRFLATFDPNGPATFNKNLDAAMAALAGFDAVAGDATKPLLGPVHDALQRYAAGFGTASTNLIAAVDHQENGLRPHLLDMQKDADAVLASLRDAFRTNATRSSTGVAFANELEAVVAVAVSLIGVFLAFVIGRSIVRPITRMTHAMTLLADGKLDVVVPARENTDAIGSMARAVEVFKQNAIEKLRLAAVNAKAHEARDRRQEAMDRHTQDFGASISGVMRNLGDSAEHMRAAAVEMAEAAKRTRDSTSTAVDDANTSARDLASVAVAAEQMSGSINEISRQLTHVTSIVTEAVDRAAETNSTVSGLSETADRIGDVVRLITDIAAQTNLLALNATIEAARAGDAGKGFAVVASEVKTLATQTARATDQIGAQILAIRTSTSEAVEAVRQVSSAIDQVASVATTIAAAMEEQAVATQEISGRVQNVTQATNNVVHAMELVDEIAQRTDAASGRVLSTASEVGDTAITLRGEVNDFLDAVSRGDSEERRAYERIPGAGARATLSIAGSAHIEAEVKNMSRGGIVLACTTLAPAGADAEIGFASGGTVSGRIARSDRGSVTVAFRQDPASLAILDRVLHAIRQRTLAEAA